MKFLHGIDAHASHEMGDRFLFDDWFPGEPQLRFFAENFADSDCHGERHRKKSGTVVFAKHEPAGGQGKPKILAVANHLLEQTMVVFFQDVSWDVQPSREAVRLLFKKRLYSFDHLIGLVGLDNISGQPWIDGIGKFFVLFGS